MRDILKYGVSDHMGARVDLEELAMKALKYSMAEGFTHADLNEQVRDFPSKALSGLCRAPPESSEWHSEQRQKWLTTRLHRLLRG